MTVRRLQDVSRNKGGRPADIRCPRCEQLGKTKILDSRTGTTADGYEVRRRRRHCRLCDYRWTTLELRAEDYDQIIRIGRAARALNEALSA